ncbi:MAG: DNA glycosylase AlkZ-like family protein [Gaiellales bacterium]|jgi:hypothetical protein
MVRTVDHDRARRIAVRAQLLDGSATGVLETVRRLGFLQIDPIATVATPQELVLWSRLGAFDRGELDRLLWSDRQLFEWNALIWPIESLPMVRAWMRAYRRANTSARERWWRQFLEQNQGFRRYVLRELERRGPLLSRDLEDRAAERGRRHRWHGTRHVGRMLEILQLRGEIGIVGRSGGQRLWDVADRWQAPDDQPLTRRDADRLFAKQRFRALGVRLVKGEWQAHPDISDEPVGDRVTVLSPFDRLIHDRRRAEALFGFRYRLEMYVPPAKREYGYYVLPVLRGDRIVGRIEPRFDRRTGDMQVLGRWGDTSHVDPVLERLRGFLRTATG